MRRILFFIIITLIQHNLCSQNADHLIPFKCDKKWGFSNENKEVIIEPQYDKVNLFKNGFAVVQIDKKVGVIDYTGKSITETKWEYISNYDNLNKIFRAKRNIRDTDYVYLNMSGEEIKKTRFKSITGCGSTFRNFPKRGLAHLYIHKKNDKFGFVEFTCNNYKNDSCKIFHDAKFTMAKEIGENLIALKTHKRWIICDYLRNVCKIMYFDDFSDVIKAHDINKMFYQITANKKIGLLDTDGNFIFDCIYEKIEYSHNFLFKVKHNKNEYFIDYYGRKYTCE